MADILKSIPGIKIFEVEGEKCLAVGSRLLNQNDVEEISKVNDVSKILFYSITFKVNNLSVLENTAVQHVTVRHGNFSNQELKQVCAISTIKVVNVYDTLVTDDCIEVIKSDNKKITISVKKIE